MAQIEKAENGWIVTIEDTRRVYYCGREALLAVADAVEVAAIIGHTERFEEPSMRLLTRVSSNSLNE